VRAFVVAVACTVLAAGCAYTQTEITPKIPENAQSSKIYAADGTLITTLHGPQNRLEVTLDRIPLRLQNAVIAIEDERFYYHRGVDFRAIFRAAQHNATEGEVTQGGSTITQQLVKNTLLNSGQTLDRKIQEASLAWQLEEHYSKKRILEIYLNTVYFGNGAYGVEAASEQYFGHPVEQTTAVQAATLAGLIQAPSADDPVLHPDAAVARRNVVLAKMQEQGYLSEAERDSGIAEPLGLAPTPTQDRYPAGHFVEEVKKSVSLDERFGATQDQRDYALFSGGLRIYTTIDLRLQAAAEQAVADVMPDPEGPEAAVVAVDPRNGYVRAMVGGRDFFGTQRTAKCNLAIGCNPDPDLNGRGTGSAFKPFVLATALDEGIPLSENIPAPGFIHLDPPTGPWDVHNADPGEGAPGGTNLVEGTVHSFNTLYAQLILQVGPQNAIDMAKKLGLTGKLQALPSAVLGANNVTVLDMASAYGTFANRGVHVNPVMITKITNAAGSILFENPHEQTKAIDAPIADTVTSVLQQVIARGTGTAAQEPFPVAGKTGTGEFYKNAWFCGYTATLSTAVWAGFPGAEVEMSPPTTAITVYGGTWPAQIWKRFMAAAQGDAAPVDFAPPPPPTTTTTVPGPPTTIPSEGLLPVPDVRGLSYGDAARAIAGAGFTPSRFDIVTDAWPAGTVSGQSPPGGSTSPRGALVTLEVAMPHGDSVTVPNVFGMKRNAAVSALHDSGLAVDVIEEESPDNNQPQGRVWKQSPQAGATVSAGSTVTIYVNPSG
jgi:penicillin-binding protein 1A